MKELDFSKFKKTSQDKNSATLKHPDGHEIKIAVSGLTSAMKKKLAGLPLHQEKAEEPVEAIEADLEPETPQEEVTPELAAATPAPTQAEGSVAAQAPAPAPTQISAAPQEPTTPASPQGTVPAPLAPDQEAQEMLHGQLKFGSDLASGHVQPKTYHDLYAKKDTLGKIGTLFGLMLSGAGSGLTHQPNALLDMMNKEIERDFDAQKTDLANKQNWYKASIDHDRMLSENALRGAQTDVAHNEAALGFYNNQQAGITDANALNYASAGAIQYMQGLVDKMPPGWQKNQAQQELSTKVTQSFLNTAMQRNSNAAQNKAAINTAANNIKVNPPPNASNPNAEVLPGAKYDAVDNRKFAAMIQKGKNAPNAPDAIPERFRVDASNEKAKLGVNRNNAADWDDSFNKLANMNEAGQFPAAAAIPAIATGLAGAAGAAGTGGFGTALAAGLGNIVGHKAGESVRDYFERNRNVQVEALKSRLGRDMSDPAKEALANSFLPSWQDRGDPIRLAEVHRKGLQHFESNPAEETPTLDLYKGLKFPMPNYKYHAPKIKGSENKNTAASSAAPMASSPQPTANPASEGILQQMFWPTEREQRGK